MSLVTRVFYPHTSLLLATVDTAVRLTAVFRSSTVLSPHTAPRLVRSSRRRVCIEGQLGTRRDGIDIDRHPTLVVNIVAGSSLRLTHGEAL